MDELIVKRMVLNFKLDPEGRIWLTYCSSMRIEPKEFVIFHFFVILLLKELIRQVTQFITLNLRILESLIPYLVVALAFS